MILKEAIQKDGQRYLQSALTIGPPWAVRGSVFLEEAFILYLP